MKIIARGITFTGNLPSAGMRPGAISYDVRFEIEDAGQEVTLTFAVATGEGMGKALELGRAELIKFAEQLVEEAKSGDLGHGPRRLF